MRTINGPDRGKEEIGSDGQSEVDGTRDLGQELKGKHG